MTNIMRELLEIEIKESRKMLSEKYIQEIDKWDLQSEDLDIFEYGRIKGLEYAQRMLNRNYSDSIVKFPKYKENLIQVGNLIYSYTTNVAKIEDNNLIVLGYWSPTTSKHINYVANYYNLNIIKNEKSN